MNDELKVCRPNGLHSSFSFTLSSSWPQTEGLILRKRPDLIFCKTSKHFQLWFFSLSRLQFWFQGLKMQHVNKRLTGTQLCLTQTGSLKATRSPSLWKFATQFFFFLDVTAEDSITFRESTDLGDTQELDWARTAAMMTLLINIWGTKQNPERL